MATALDESRLRAEVLRYYYDFYRQNAGDGQWSNYAGFDIAKQINETEPEVVISESEITRAVYYLSEKGLLRIIDTQSFISGEPTMIRAEITGHGIDVFEEPDDFANELPSRVVQQINIFHGNANVVQGNQSGPIVQGDQQNVGRDNYGTMAQGNAVVSLAESFPAEALRNQLAGNPDAVAAVDGLEAELKSEKPNVGKVYGFIHVLKACSNIADVGKIFGTWLADPNTHQHLHSLATSMWS